MLNFSFPFFEVEIANCSFLFFDGEMVLTRLLEMFFRLKYFIVSNSCKNKVAVRFCLNQIFRSNFLNIMSIREPVRSIYQPSNSGRGANDGLEFIRCVGGQHPEIHEAWIFGDGGITPEVHPFARVGVGAFVRGCFAN